MKNASELSILIHLIHANGRINMLNPLKVEKQRFLLNLNIILTLVFMFNKHCRIFFE